MKLTIFGGTKMIFKHFLIFIYDKMDTLNVIQYVIQLIFYQINGRPTF